MFIEISLTNHPSSQFVGLGEELVLAVLDRAHGGVPGLVGVVLEELCVDKGGWGRCSYDVNKLLGPSSPLF